MHVPGENVRAWRRMIGHRRKLVASRIRAKNAVRALLRSQGIEAPKGLWTRKGMDWLRNVSMTTELDELQRDILCEQIDSLTQKTPIDRRSAPTTRCTREGHWTSRPRRSGFARDSRHHPPLAPATDCPEVDSSATIAGSPPNHAGHRGTGRADGPGESTLGLHANPGGTQKRWPSGWPDHNREHFEGERFRSRTEAGQANDVAPIPSGSLGCARGG